MLIRIMFNLISVADIVEQHQKTRKKVKFLDGNKVKFEKEIDIPPFDDLRNYAYEGQCSTAGSLHSLTQGYLL